MTYNRTLRPLKYISDGKRKFCPEKKKNMWQRQYQQSPDSIVAVSFLPTQDTQTNRIKSSDLLNVLSSLLQNHFYLCGPRWLLLLSLQFTFLRTNSINKNIRPMGLSNKYIETPTIAISTLF